MISSKSVQHLSIIKPQDLWETPGKYYSLGIQLTGIKPKLDVCATAQNSKCLNYFSENDDALKQEWKHDFWMNPPYSRIDEFMQHAYEQHLLHNVSGLCLVYNKSDTNWYWDWVKGKAKVEEIKGRIRFLKDGMPSENSAPYPSIFVAYHKRT